MGHIPNPSQWDFDVVNEQRDEGVVRGALRVDGVLLGTLSARFERTLGLRLASA